MKAISIYAFIICSLSIKYNKRQQNDTTSTTIYAKNGNVICPLVIVLCEMLLVLSRIWTRVTVSISYDDNHYTTGTSKWINNKIENIILLSFLIIFDKIKKFCIHIVLNILHYLLNCEMNHIWYIPVNWNMNWFSFNS